jgi:5-methylthioadenosine/S-adenosylhomocysteine deaminase
MPPFPCDLLITDGTVICRPERAAVLRDGAVAIAADEIIAVGPSDALARDYAAKHVLSAGGGIVMPGFINTHNHSPLKIVRGIAPDLGFAPAYIKDIPQGDTLSGDDALALARLGNLELLLLGTTTVVDHYQHAEACARATDELGLRAFVGGRILDTDVGALARGAWKRDPARGERTIRDTLDAYERWDGHDGGRIRGVIAAHAPDTCSTELLAEVRDLAAAKKAKLHLHLAQSPIEVERVTQRTGQHPVDLLDSLGMLNESLIAAHCICVDDDRVRRMGEARIGVAHTPVGNAQGCMSAPMWTLRQAGAVASLCTDSKSADMFEVMRAALWVARLRGSGFDVRAETVLGWATVGGAAVLGLEHCLGLVAPRYKADLLVLDSQAPGLYPLIDPIGTLVHSGAGQHVRHVVVAGRLVVEDRMPTRVRPREVIAQGQRVAERLWQQSGYRATPQSIAGPHAALSP